MQFDDVNIGGQLIVGTGVCPGIKAGAQAINGSVLAEGPVVFGEPGAFGAQEATLMVGPCSNNDPDSTLPESSLGISGGLPPGPSPSGIFFPVPSSGISSRSFRGPGQCGNFSAGPARDPPPPPFGAVPVRPLPGRGVGR